MSRSGVLGGKQEQLRADAVGNRVGHLAAEEDDALPQQAVEDRVVEVATECVAPQHGAGWDVEIRSWQPFTADCADREDPAGRLSVVRPN